MSISVDSLRALRDNSLEVYCRFLSEYSATDKDKCYVFVEGKDDPALYRALINQELPDGKSAMLYASGSKRIIKRIYDLIDWANFSKEQIVFIIDKDLSPFYEENSFSAPNLYVTEMYSMENSVICRESFIDVCRDVLGYSLNMQNELDRLANLFDTARDSFEKAMAPVMANIIMWKRKGILPANYNNFKVKEVFEIKDGKYKAKRCEHDCIALLYRQSQVSFEHYDVKVVSGIMSEIAGSYRTIVRGKYLVVFFCQFCKSIKEDIKGIGIEPTSHSIDIGLNNFYCLVPPKRRSIPSFRDFLQKTVVQFFKNQCNGVSAIVS